MTYNKNKKKKGGGCREIFIFRISYGFDLNSIMSCLKMKLSSRKTIYSSIYSPLNDPIEIKTKKPNENFIKTQ